MYNLSRRDILKFAITLPFASYFMGCNSASIGASSTLEWTSINVCSDTQQGDSHLISKSEKHFLIDAGHPSVSDSHLVTYFKNNLITKLDGVMISHPHNDHYGGILALYKNNIKIDKLYMNMPTQEQMQREWWGGKYQDLIDIRDAAISKGTEILPIIQGDKFIFDKNSYLEVLYIYDGINTPVGITDINDMSAITMINDRNNRFLLTGDLNHKLGSFLADNAHNINADIVKVPHHATEGLAPNRFFEKVNPQDIIVTSPKYLWCSERSSRIKTLANSNKYGTFINGFHGDITVASDGNKYEILTQYYDDKICEI